ncbi:hypothetical protein Phum_PHUM483650 [Pediculus humanus corporis]|uniref:Uncharacterized protein n=1 Tax=Pediculus humanus subsp. corporis TaxID=121224 RepID=E0VWG9_PEDHC|nr:uncharacterized protein Phum_PHUM483650 [Pediculus humanus corporis]EEB17725.1 hypothetical protein Phum_PHUM483650 [Pediculus humanus corporis]
MKKIKSSTFCWTLIVVIGSLFLVRTIESVSLCTKMSAERGVTEYENLCDLEFCSCRDPFGQMKCTCTAEEGKNFSKRKPKLNSTCC